MLMHRYLKLPSDEFGIDSGRPRYFVACLTCKVVLHSSTTGPNAWDESHEAGRLPPERPLSDQEKGIIDKFLGVLSEAGKRAERDHRAR